MDMDYSFNFFYKDYGYCILSRKHIHEYMGLNSSSFLLSKSYYIYFKELNYSMSLKLSQSIDFFRLKIVYENLVFLAGVEYTFIFES
ncbi:hypothetical protein C1646_691843 [Rhizophagus diaphanus]|nr:hypothetical protein C1646_691843 [Rhizophagus diaphanus] [Rhizophagus sp. MUCL 43196]